MLNRTVKGICTDKHNVKLLLKEYFEFRSLLETIIFPSIIYILKDSRNNLYSILYSERQRGEKIMPHHNLFDTVKNSSYFCPKIISQYK